MIFVDISKLNVSEKWKEKAHEATSSLIPLSKKERTEFIKKNSHIWKALKSELVRISKGKCWYCETRYVRADFHVDHHRPKNRLRDEKGEKEGYWWLAFDYKNFRLACSYCNSLHKCPDGETRGKSDFFPLNTGCTRATLPGSNLDDEVPLLLDPIMPVDTTLLWFMEDGKAYPKDTNDQNLSNLRAKKTIELLNLNDPKINEARREKWLECKRLIDQADEASIHYNKGSPAGIQKFNCLNEKMRELMCSSSEYSATARACFSSSHYSALIQTVK